MARVSWRDLISKAFDETNECWEDVISTTLTGEQMDKPFDDGFGGSEGVSFTLWTTNRVYFPVVYDGAEWVGSAPRNPCDEAMTHQGGQ